MLKRTNDTNISENPSKKFKQKLPASPPKSDLPSDVLKWMKKNAAPKMALKLMQICKYFQHQEFPYFVANDFCGIFESFEYLRQNSKTIDLKTLEKKLWITERVYLYVLSETLMKQLFTKIAYCDIKELTIKDGNTITFENYKMLTAAGNVEILELETPITKENEIVPLEHILEGVPKLVYLQLNTIANSFKSYEKAIEVLPRGLKWLFFDVHVGIYDFGILFALVQNNQKIKFRITQILPMNNTEWIMPSINDLQSHVDNLLKAWSPVNDPPDIDFEGQSLKSKTKLRKLTRRFKKQKNAA